MAVAMAALRFLFSVNKNIIKPNLLALSSNSSFSSSSSAAAITTTTTSLLPLLPNIDEFTPININNLAFVPGSTKRRRIIGRGDGSTRGNMCGRGNKGQKARSKGPHPRMAFSGGQYPFFLFPPKIIVTKCPLQRLTEKLPILTLGRLQQWIDAGRIDISKKITMYELVKSGVLSSSCVRLQGVRLVDENPHLLKSSINIELTQFAPLAIHAIEKCGGSAISVWFGQLELRALIYPEKLRLYPKLQTQPDHQSFIDYYSDLSNRGYLALGVKQTYPAPTALSFFRGLEKPIYSPEPIKEVKIISHYFPLKNNEEEKEEEEKIN